MGDIERHYLFTLNLMQHTRKHHYFSPTDLLIYRKKASLLYSFGGIGLAPLNCSIEIKRLAIHSNCRIPVAD